MGRLKEILSELSKCNNPYNGLGVLFSTRNYDYFYDRGTGKVCCCGKKEYEVLSLVLLGQIDKIGNLDNVLYEEALENVYQLIINENMMRSSDNFEFENIKNLENQVENELEHLVLELTEQCNLNCRYCIYNEFSDTFRDFSLKNMSVETMRKAVEYGLNHCNQELTIGFYGGEPLMQYELIKEVVNYVNKININNKKINYSLTTNLVLMNNERANFFASVENFFITCSIDGPKEVQDLYRLKRNDTGSFDEVEKGLKCLVEAYGKSAQKYISIYSVITPPFSEKRMDSIADYFSGLKWLPKGMNFSYTKVKEGTVPKQFEKLYRKEGAYDFEVVQKWTLNKLLEAIDEDEYVVKCEKSDLMKIHNRMLVNSPQKTIPLNGCCIPGKRRVYVTCEGEFMVCEKIGKSPIVGNVISGIDFNVLNEKYVKDYKEKSKSKCLSCWASYLCPVCYSSCYNKEGINLQDKENLCISAKENVINKLVKYHELLENNPKLLLKVINSV